MPLELGTPVRPPMPILATDVDKGKLISLVIGVYVFFVSQLYGVVSFFYYTAVVEDYIDETINSHCLTEAD